MEVFEQLRRPVEARKVSLYENDGKRSKDQSSSSKIYHLGRNMDDELDLRKRMGEVRMEMERKGEQIKKEIEERKIEEIEWQIELREMQRREFNSRREALDRVSDLRREVLDCQTEVMGWRIARVMEMERKLVTEGMTEMEREEMRKMERVIEREKEGVREMEREIEREREHVREMEREIEREGEGVREMELEISDLYNSKSTSGNSTQYPEHRLYDAQHQLPDPEEIDFSISENLYRLEPNIKTEAEQRKIRQTIRAAALGMDGSGSRASQISLYFALDSSIYDSIRQNYKPSGIALVITSDGKHDFLTTCAEYVQWAWPRLGIECLNVLNEIIAKRFEPSTGDLELSNRTITRSISCGIHSQIISGHRTRSTNMVISTGAIRGIFSEDLTFRCFQVKTTKSLAIQIAELIGWLAQAFPIRQLQDALGRKLGRSNVSIGRIPLEDGKLGFRFTADTTVQLHRHQELRHPCWLPLFHRSVVAYGFEVPSRQDQRGLEIELDTLMSLCGIEYPVEREGRIIFVGLATILLPLKILDDGSMQWHLIIDQSPNRLSKLKNLEPPISAFTEEIIETFQKDAGSQHDDQPRMSQSQTEAWPAFMDRLRGTRHFLGWCKQVEILLGTEIARYESVAWTRTSEVRTSWIPSSDNYSLGTSGKGIIGASFARTYNIVHHRDRLYPFANRENKFEEALGNHKEEQIILCDPEERRAWMVPFLNMLLHMIILRIKSEGDSTSSDALPFAKIGPDGATEALKALMRSRARIMHENEGGQPYRLEDLTKMLLIALQNAYPGTTQTRFGDNKVLGLELRDLVSCQSPFRLKKYKFQWPHGGWPHFTRDIQLVLFCRGLGEVLRPSAATLPQMCPSWRALPKGADFLAAPVRGLRHLALRTGFESGEYLMEGYKWFSPRSSFVYSCERITSKASDCSCEPLQRLERVSPLRELFPKFIKYSSASIATGSSMAPVDGAVVFGNSGVLRKTKRLVLEIGNTVMPTLQYQSAEPGLPTPSQVPQQSTTGTFQTSIASHVGLVRPQCEQHEPLKTSQTMESSSTTANLSTKSNGAENSEILNGNTWTHADTNYQSDGMSILPSGKSPKNWNNVEQDETKRKVDARRQAHKDRVESSREAEEESVKPFSDGIGWHRIEA